ncbi:VOC family protein [Nocardia brasiliensis]|uniref:VOC family protein n=1 Tax=Nocardia brasiliensis TaxID=37326 RepID=UPI001895572C|nr:VOC family protein [Nocardia brasiliensis]MBF6129903.1 VOC family protein [Nocardia brasiliensis]
MTDLDLHLTTLRLAVHDLGRAVDFYRDVLGLEVHGEPDGKLSLHVGPSAQPSVRIVLETPDAVPGISPADRRAIEELMTVGLLGRLEFRTTDCDSTFERLEAAGTEVIQEPITRSDHTRDCAFLDPSGNLLRFTQQVNL